MKKNLFKYSVLSVAMGFGALISSCAVAETVSPATDECAKELLLSYFPEPIVTEALKHFKISQDKWAGINKSLSQKDKDVVKIVEQKASAMNPNPLKDPQQRQAAVKLFRETLLTVFSDAMKENGITDSSQYQAILDDIQQQKAKKFAMCMEKQKALMQSDSSDDTNDDDDLDDDSDDDDDDTDDNSAKTPEKSAAPAQK